MATRMGTQSAKPTQSLAIPNNTLLMNFSQIGQPVFPKTCLQAKNTLQTYSATWGVTTWKQLYGWKSPRPKGQHTKWDIAYRMCKLLVIQMQTRMWQRTRPNSILPACGCKYPPSGLHPPAGLIKRSRMWMGNCLWKTNVQQHSVRQGICNQLYYNGAGLWVKSITCQIKYFTK